MKKHVVSKKDIFYRGEFVKSEIHISDAQKLLHNVQEEIKKQEEKKKIKLPWSK